MKYLFLNVHSSFWEDINNGDKKNFFSVVQHLSPRSGVKKKSIVVKFSDYAKVWQIKIMKMQAKHIIRQAHFVNMCFITLKC